MCTWNRLKIQLQDFDETERDWDNKIQKKQAPEVIHTVFWLKYYQSHDSNTCDEVE